ncbi:MAG: Holliday junction branch migration protein RuvA [Clostridia bacterium]|nr:Holliday junction branch migration protein RuvA [Clostridia bacterium]
MIYSLNGTLIYSDHQFAVIECGGVGFKFLASTKTLSSLPQKGKQAFVYTYMNVKEDAVDLFGFADTNELELFKLITSVNGVGPKIGIAILSDFTVDQLSLAIASGDAKTLTKASGVGLKIAQRIVLELKDKLASGITVQSENGSVTAADIADGSSPKDAIAALVQFGYSHSEAAATVSKCDLSKSTEDIIKQALRLLSTKF